MEKISMRWCGFALLILAFFGQLGCVPLAIGAAAGYVAHEEGYRVQAPLKKVDGSSGSMD